MWSPLSRLLEKVSHNQDSYLQLSLRLFLIFDSWIYFLLLSFPLILFAAFFFFALQLFHVTLVPLSVCPFLIPFINHKGSGHENQTFTMTTTNSGTSQQLLHFVCVLVCVAQLLNRWNACYAVDDNSVESEVYAPLYLYLPLSSPLSLLNPLLPFCSFSDLHTSPCYRLSVHHFALFSLIRGF